MNLRLKYPQQFKKQHKSRRCFPIITPLWQTDRIAPFSNISEKKYCVYMCQNIILPKKFISFIRKFFRKFFKRQHVSCWFRIQLNKVISSKSKNSRMGRGVGTANRMAYYINSRKPFCLVFNVSPKRINLFAKFLTKRLAIKLIIKSFTLIRPNHKL